MAGASYPVLYRKGAGVIRLPASAVFLAGRVLRQPHLHRRAALDNLGERLLDANRTIGQPNKITVIFGRRISKHYRGNLQTEIEDMNLPTPVIRKHYGNGFIKQYVRDHLILRTEAASNNVNDYGVKKSSSARWASKPHDNAAKREQNPHYRHYNVLKGDRRGQWVMSVNARGRICFEFRNGDAYQVEIVDYHQG